MRPNQPSSFLPVLKEDKGGDTPDLVANRDIRVQIDVEFQQDSVRTEVFCDVVKHGSHRAARPAPGSPEVHKDGLFCLENDVFKLGFVNVAYSAAHLASLSLSLMYAKTSSRQATGGLYFFA